MDIFLPIARLSLAVPSIIGAGALVGIISGMFGVGGGFLLTPLLMVLGISPTVAAASCAAGIVAGSATGTLEHSRGSTVDYRMGFWLFLGGVIGSFSGVSLIHWLNGLGPVNSFIRVFYLVVLGGTGGVMLVDSIKTWRQGNFMSERRFDPVPKRRLIDFLPFRMHFPASGIRVSFILPIVFGAIVGIIASMGAGGGFVMVPLLVYVLGMRMHVAAGTSLFQILLTCMVVTVLQSGENHNVDFILAYLLAMGAMPAAMIGARLGRRMRADQLKILLALVILSGAVEVSFELFRTPATFLSSVAR